MQWIKKKTGPPSEQVSGADLVGKKTTVKKAIAYIGPLDTELFAAHNAAAKDPAVADAFEFLHTSDESVAGDFGLSGPGIVIIRNFDENLTTYSGDATKEAIVAFAQSKLTPRLINFDEDSIDPIFGKKNPAIILFSNEKDQEYQKTFAAAAEAL